MPSKGFHYRRNNIITKKLHKKFLLETGLDIDYQTYKNIILDSNQVIFDTIANDPAGFKLPENLGYIIVTKYKTDKKSTDWQNSKKYKKTIYHTNLHSFGKRGHIKWSKLAIARFKFNRIYKFKACRFLARKVSHNITENKVDYFTWKNTDFYSSSKLDRFYNKKFKTQDT